MSPNSKISLVPNQTKKIFNIDMWTTAFLRFMAIYTEQFSFEAPQLLKYAEIVRDLARRTQNLSWYTYDQQFRTLRETVQIPWGRIHTEFWIMASHSQPQRSFRPTFRTSSITGIRHTPEKENTLRTHAGHTTGVASAGKEHADFYTNVEPAKETILHQIAQPSQEHCKTQEGSMQVTNKQ